MKLMKLGSKIVSPRLSAIITSPESGTRKKSEFESKDDWKEWRHKNERLLDGEEKRFEEIGLQIGESRKGAVPLSMKVAFLEESEPYPKPQLTAFLGVMWKIGDSPSFQGFFL